MNPGAWLIVGGLAVFGLALLLGEHQGHQAQAQANPLPSKKKRLIAKGHSVFFEMADGREIKASGSMMLHDPSGKAWPKNSILFGAIRRGSRRAAPEELEGSPAEYFGSSYQARIGSVDLPPKSLQGWQRVGRVSRIYYSRGGKSHPGRYQHPFNERGGLLGLSRHPGKVILYRRGRYFRLQLPRDAVVNHRGFVHP